jgi:hypothetical protein
VDNAYTTDEDTPLTVAAPGVLDNDSDPDGDPLTAVPVGDVSHGTLDLHADGSFTYTPNAGYSGPDSFTYRANDGAANSNPATVNIAVNVVYYLPLVVRAAYTTDEGAPLTVDAQDVLGNDGDADGNTLTAILIGGASHGALAPNIDWLLRLYTDFRLHRR